MLEIAWLALLAWLVARTRRWRLPRTLHLAGWMFVLLAVSLLRAWLFPTVGSPWDNEAFRDAISPQHREGVATMVDAVAIGFWSGLNAALELTAIMVASWVGGLLREQREPARVSVVRRIPLVALHLPLAAALCGAGVALAAGSLRLWCHADALGAARIDVAPAIGIVVGTGLWLAALLHVDRMFAIRRGGLATRLALAFAGIVATVFVLAVHTHVHEAVSVIVWCVAQLAAVRFARPGAAAG